MIVHLVRLWARLYTLGMPAGVRHARVSEIDSDLWESLHDADRVPRPLEMLARLLLGMPDDVLWRLEHAADAMAPPAPAPRSVTVSAFSCSIALHVIAVACVAWSWPLEPPAFPVSMLRAQKIEGSAVPAAAPLTASATLAPTEKDQAMKNAALLIGTLVTAVGLPVAAQQPAADPVFEAATVRPNTSGYGGWRLEPQAGGRLTGTNVPAAALIRFAYDLPEFQVSGGPGWLDSTRFDIAAKAEDNATVAQTRLMLRALLAERFKLTSHTERRELPIYALVMARGDGRPGPQLRRSEADCSRADLSSGDWSGIGPVTGPPSCGFFGFAPGTDLPKGRGGLAFRGLTLAAFAKRLVPIVRRSVSDHTGLTGFYDADFDFVAELPPPPPPPGMPSAFSDPFVSAFTVLPEQLGLKLDSRRGPVDVLVIDRIEPPRPE